MGIRFVALETKTSRELQAGGTDAYGNKPHVSVSDGGAIPCRHCLRPVAKGEEYFILAHRPFPAEQPYAETGPIFLHVRECDRAPDSPRPAQMYDHGGSYILRGYRDNGWINYSAAEVVDAARLAERAAALLELPDVAYLHMRSSRYNCYQCRIERAE